MSRHRIRDLWAEASPLNLWRWPIPGMPEPRWAIATYRLMVPAQRIVRRQEAAWHLLKGSGRHAATMRGLRYRLKALLLLLGPIRWDYPVYPSPADDVASYGDRTWNGGEQTCWEATFVAVRPGWRPGLAHIYRDGGP